MKTSESNSSNEHISMQLMHILNATHAKFTLSFASLFLCYLLSSTDLNNSFVLWKLDLADIKCQTTQLLSNCQYSTWQTLYLTNVSFLLSDGPFPFSTIKLDDSWFCLFWGCFCPYNKRLVPNESGTWKPSAVKTVWTCHLTCWLSSERSPVLLQCQYSQGVTLHNGSLLQPAE